MEMDFKYKQYGFENFEKKEGEQSVEASKPHQEVLNYFNENKGVYKFDDFHKILKTINGDVDLVLEDGTKVKVFSSNDLIKLGVKYPDGTHFMGMWTTIKDEEEFLKAL